MHPILSSLALIAFPALISPAHADSDPRCQTAFVAANWLQPKDASQAVTASESKTYLLQFSKPHGFQENFASTISRILDSYSEVPFAAPADLIYGAIEGVLLEDPDLYETLTTKYRDFFAHLELSNPALRNQCRTPEEVTAIENAVDSLLKKIIPPASNRPSDDQNLLSTCKDLFRPLRYSIAALPDSEKSILKENLALRLLHGFDSHIHPGVFPSLLGKIALDSIQPIFNEKTVGLTQFSYVQSSQDGIVTAVIVSSVPFATDSLDQKTDGGSYGIYAIFPSVISTWQYGSHGANISHQDYAWSVRDQVYTGTIDVNIRKTPVLDLAPKAASLDYKALLKNHHLTGMVVAGSNLDFEGETVLGQYEEYYEEQGFKLGERIEVPNLENFLAEKMKSGEIGYFIKEAHAGGDSENIVTLSRKGFYTVGTRHGRETVYLVHSDQGDQNYFHLSRREFAGWIHDQKTPFVYLNTSCWSAQLSASDIALVANPLFTEISSTEMVRFFFNDSTSIAYASPEKIILDGIRKKKSYAEIRSVLSQVNTYRSHGEDTFIFPDEDQYESSIRRNLKQRVPVDIQVKQIGPDGRPYDIGGVNH